MDNKPIFYILLLFLGITGIAVYYNYFLGVDTVYTHLFYLVIIMVTFWFTPYALPVALFFGLLHISLDLLSSGGFPLAVFLRVMIMLVITIVVSNLKRQLDIKEEQLVSLNEVFHLLLKNMPNFLTIYDIQGRYVMISEMTAQSLGCPAAEIAGKQFSQVLPGPVISDLMDNTAKLLRTKEPLTVITEIQAIGGRKILETRLFPLKYTEERIELIGALGIDITDREEAQQKMEEAYQNLEQVIELLPDATFVIDADSKVMFWNKAMEEMTGVAKGKIIGKGDYEYAIPFYGQRCKTLIDHSLMSLGNGPEHDPQWGDKYDTICEKEGVLFVECLLPNIYNGKGAYVLSSAAQLRSNSGKVIGAIQTIRDITDRREMERLLFYEREELRITLLSIGDGFISTDKKGNILMLNKIAQELTGWSAQDAVGRPFDEVFHIVNEFTGRRCDNIAQGVLATGNIMELGNHIILVAKDGSKRPIEDSAAPVKDKNGNIIGVVVVFRDYSVKKERQAKIEYLSFHDQLTGLYNRRFFEEALNRLDTEKNLPLTLVMADVNGLKMVNDAFGHLQGDKVLQKISRNIEKVCRKGDILARIGGDEFVLLLPETNQLEAGRIIDRVKTAIAEEKMELIELSVSFGSATKIMPSEDTEKIFKKAEDRMYQHKLYESPSMRNNTVKTIIRTLHEKLPGEKKHSDRVGEICENIAREMGYRTNEIAELRTAALLHDIGKIILSDAIVNKPGDLNDSEWAEVKRHPEIGYRILSSVNEMSQLAEYVLAHHENWDGSGYPKRLKGYDIPEQSRIIRIADAYDAMTSNRCYRRALPEVEAISQIKANAGIQFDPFIAELFIERVLA